MSSDIDLDDIAENDPSLEQRCQFPLEWTEQDEGPTLAEIRESAIEEIKNANPDELVVIVGDYGDSDGKGTVGVLKALYNDTDTDVVYVPASHRNKELNPVRSLSEVEKVIPEGVHVYFTDLSPNQDGKEEYIDVLTDIAETNELHIRDHHPWPNEVIEALENNADLVVDDDQENPVCSTQILIREDWPNAPDYITELGEVTAIRDLWKKDQFDEEPRNADLAEYSFVAEYGEYSDAVAEYGADICDDPEIRETIDNRVKEKEDRIQYVADNFTDWYEIDDWDVAIAYGNCYPSGLCSELIDRGADVAAIAKPTGKVSVRSNKDTPLALHIASSIGGGGHPNAAGCQPDVVVKRQRYNNLSRGVDKDKVPYVTYKQHWESKGSFEKTVMLSNILNALQDINDITDVEYVNENGNVDMSLVEDEDTE